MRFWWHALQTAVHQHQALLMRPEEAQLLCCVAWNITLHLKCTQRPSRHLLSLDAAVHAFWTLATTKLPWLLPAGNNWYNHPKKSICLFTTTQEWESNYYFYYTFPLLEKKRRNLGKMYFTTSDSLPREIQYDTRYKNIERSIGRSRRVKKEKIYTDILHSAKEISLFSHFSRQASILTAYGICAKFIHF